MPSQTLDLEMMLQPDETAKQISETWVRWKNSRARWETMQREVSSYIFATDTTTTTNSKLPWKNKTTRPKLCQIRDNLHANYMAALFPNDTWFKWEADDEDGSVKDKATAVEAFMRHKFKESKFKQTASRLVLDYIDCGNPFGDVEFVNEFTVDERGAAVTAYIGPRLVRVSPFDIVFDITAPSFEQSPKIVRSLLSFGQVEKLLRTNPDWQELKPVIDRIKKNRMEILGQKKALESTEMAKIQRYIADGFNSLLEYYSSGMVEILQFEGDLYNPMTGKLYENHEILIVDRCYILREKPISNWFGRSYKQHVGWRLRPDNLMAMGPLENLVGLQYRLDHLENLKADAFDLIAHPPTKVKGYVEDFQWGPGEKIFMEETSDVEMLSPDTTVLNADLQIQQIEQTMEDMAGAPKQAMGIRTPGEKTAYEVSELQNGASRMFQQKISFFEEMFLEPLMNSMLEIARRNMTEPEVIKIVSPEDGVAEFMKITPDDLKAKGRLVPYGARHFAAQAQLMQNLTNLTASGLYQDPMVVAHLSSKKLAKLVEDNLGLEKYGVYSPNIRIEEQAESMQLQQQVQEELMVNAMTPTSSAEDPLPGAGPTEPEEELDV